MGMRGIVVLLLGLVWPWQTSAAEGPVSVAEIVEVTEAVERHHVRPSTRQEMVLAAGREIYEHSVFSKFRVLTPQLNAEMSQVISKLVTTEEISAFLTKALNEACPELVPERKQP